MATTVFDLLVALALVRMYRASRKMTPTLRLHILRLSWQAWKRAYAFSVAFWIIKILMWMGATAWIGWVWVWLRAMPLTDEYLTNVEWFALFGAILSGTVVGWAYYE